MTLTVTIKASDPGKIKEAMEVIDTIKKAYPNAIFYIEVIA